MCFHLLAILDTVQGNASQEIRRCSDDIFQAGAGALAIQVKWFSQIQPKTVAADQDPKDDERSGNFGQNHMWVRFEEDEIVEILAAMPVGNVASKLKAVPDPYTAAFAAAVQVSDDLEIDTDVLISRGEEGAFVMSWVWVPNERAGLDCPDFDDEGVDDDQTSPHRTQHRFGFRWQHLEIGGRKLLQRLRSACQHLRRIGWEGSSRTSQIDGA